VYSHQRRGLLTKVNCIIAKVNRVTPCCSCSITAYNIERTIMFTLENRMAPVVVVAILLSSSAYAAAPFTVVERADTDTVVDVGAKGDSIGDLLTFANPIYDAANQGLIGRDHGYCVRVVAGKSWECFWTLTLKGGLITSEGTFSDVGDSVMTVTGGTGQYLGAKGSLLLHPRDDKSTAYDFKYELK
jgi:hypothetical protein